MLILNFIVPTAQAYKTYSYDEHGKRFYTSSPTYSGTNASTYIYDADGNRTGRIKHMPNGRTNVYDANGNKIKSYVSRPNGRTYVYDNNGNKIGSLKTRPNVPVFNNYGTRRPMQNTTTIQYGTFGNLHPNFRSF